MLACPRLVLAAAIAASPVTPTQAAGTCPNERADAGADANLGNCLGDARESRRANEPRLAAAAYARALMFAREAYAAGKKEGAAADWYAAAGEQIVHYGTEGCALASNLTGEAPRAMLTACFELLDEFLADLEAVNAGASRSAAAARQRRAELEPLLAGLPAPPQPEAPPIARPTAPRGEPTSASPRPVLSLRRPTGLDAGLGVSAAVAGLAIAGLVVGDGLGRRAHAAALSGPDAAGAPVGVDLCEAMASAVGCDDLRSARRLFVASGVTLGVALAATALFAGLRVRHARRARVSASWSGPRAGVAVHF
ncbi:hypothetical protein OV203_33210 [Nannocystis sp. ILAH1]|uniref:hypothetical protein n=1 Tax=unclassified Nannocystis TaxID=2627009 RepID=UPI00226F7B6F|nr:MULTISPECIES: hypothetical protein [unclassified Nannocystis]MCY0992045.1 hypothetical protein [Nannocystis sp. ILAH1]MCY1064293.1 hypothetical protein [Nannocystis sp. RBIL2]